MKHRLSWIIGLLVVLAMYLVAPTIASLVWHHFHGDSVSYEGRTIPIPSGWIAKHDGSYLLITHLTHSWVPRLFRGDGISIHQAPGTTSQRAEAFHGWVMRAEQKSEEVFPSTAFVGTQRLTVAAQEVFCADRIDKKQRSKHFIVCATTDGLLTTFSGDAQSTTTFYKVLTSIR